MENHLAKSCGSSVVPQIQCSEHFEASFVIVLHHSTPIFTSVVEIPWSHHTLISFTALPSTYCGEVLGFFGFYPRVMVEIMLAEVIKVKTRCALSLYGNSNYFLLLLQTSGGMVQTPTHRAEVLRNSFTFC